MAFKRVVLLIGYSFVSVISFLSAFMIADVVWKILLMASAVVSLLLAIIRFVDSQKTQKELAELKNNQLDVKVEKSTLKCFKATQQ